MLIVVLNFDAQFVSADSFHLCCEYRHHRMPEDCFQHVAAVQWSTLLLPLWMWNVPIK